MQNYDVHMFKKQIPLNIKRSKNIYSFKQKLTGRGSFNFQLRRIITTEGVHCKHVKLTLTGLLKGHKKRINKVVENLSYYNQENTVPKLYYSDAQNIVVEWIDGKQLTGLTKNAETLKKLAQINAESFIHITKIPIQQKKQNLIKSIQALGNSGFITNKTESDLYSVLDSNNLNSLNSIYEGLCFADTATKNYILKPEIQGMNLVYIDIFGIDRRTISSVFAKQLIQTPKEFRKEYFSTFKSVIPVDIEPNIPFSYFDYLVSRIFSCLEKKSFIRRKRRKIKAEKALNDLLLFIDAEKNNESLLQFILQKPP